MNAKSKPDTFSQKPKLMDSVRAVMQILCSEYRAGIPKHANGHNLRHSLATLILKDGNDIGTIRELLGHNNVSPTMLYTRVLNQGCIGMRPHGQVIAAKLTDSGCRIMQEKVVC